MGKLTVRKIETAKGPTKLVDEHGLYLRVSPRGAKTWIQRLTIQGKRTDNSIGHYPAMGLAEARTAAFERWKVAKTGGDPRVAGGKPTSPTFREVAAAVIAMHAPGWRGPKSEQGWRASLDTYVHPVIGDLPVAEVTPGHVMSVIQPIWNEKRETARRVKQCISAICRWTVAQGHRTDDPAGIDVLGAARVEGVQGAASITLDEAPHDGLSAASGVAHRDQTAVNDGHVGINPDVIARAHPRCQGIVSDTHNERLGASSSATPSFVAPLAANVTARVLPRSLVPSLVVLVDTVGQFPTAPCPPLGRPEFTALSSRCMHLFQAADPANRGHVSSIQALILAVSASNLSSPR